MYKRFFFHFWQIKEYEKKQGVEERLQQAREIFDNYIMKELLSCSHVSMATMWFFKVKLGPFCAVNMTPREIRSGEVAFVQ